MVISIVILAILLQMCRGDRKMKKKCSNIVDSISKLNFFFSCVYLVYHLFDMHGEEDTIKVIKST